MDPGTLQQYLGTQGFLPNEGGDGWYNPAPSEGNSNQAGLEEANYRYGLATAKDTQGRPMWGSEGAPNWLLNPLRPGTGEAWSPLMSNGQDVAQLGQSENPLGPAPTYDPRYGYVTPRGPAIAAQKAWQGMNPGDDWMDNGPLLVAMIASMGLASGAAAGGAAGGEFAGVTGGAGGLEGVGGAVYNPGAFAGATGGAGLVGSAGGAGVGGAGDAGGDGFDMPQAEQNYGFDQGAWDSVLNSYGGQTQGLGSPAVGDFSANVFTGQGGPGEFAGPIEGGVTTNRWDELLKLYKGIQPYSSVASGIQGLLAAQKQRGLAEQYAKQASPFDQYGGRAIANGQLNALMQDPTGAAQNDPAYKLRIQAAQRAAAPYGQGSGRMAVAAANAGTDWYNNRLAQLGQLAGAGFSPGQGGQLSLMGNAQANQLTSASLGSIGYGLTSAFGGQSSEMLSPAVAQLLRLISAR